MSNKNIVNQNFEKYCIGQVYNIGNTESQFQIHGQSTKNSFGPSSVAEVDIIEE